MNKSAGWACLVYLATKYANISPITYPIKEALNSGVFSLTISSSLNTLLLLINILVRSKFRQRDVKTQGIKMSPMPTKEDFPFN